MRFWRQIVYGGLLMATWSETVHAGAWPTPEGEGQLISTSIYDTASKSFDPDGDLVGGTDFSKLDQLFFLEHGLTRKITFVAATSFQEVDYVGRNGREQYTGFGDSQIGLRYNILKSPKWTLSVQGLGIIGGAGETVSDADLGNGGNGLDIRALIGRSLEISDKKAFAEVQAGWRYRAEGFPDEWHVDATFGIETAPKLKLIAQGFYTSTDSALAGIDRIRGNESLKLAGSAVYARKEGRQSIQLGVFQTVAGRNIVQEKAVFASLWQRY